jgi:hypothetical protein
MIALLFLASAYALDCPEGVPPAALDASLDEAEEAVLDLDDEAFRDDVNTLTGLLLPCAAEVTAPAQAARIHRTMAARRFAVGDEQGAKSAARAARHLDPEADFGALLPDTHDLSLAWSEAEPVRARRVPEARSGSTSFDGVNGRERPVGVPTVFQVLDNAGLPTSTVYLGPNEPLPAYPAIPRRRNALLVCTGAGVVLGGVAYGLAWAERSAMLEAGADPDTPGSKLLGQRRAANALSVSSGFAFGAAAGCGVGAVLVGER